MATYCRRSQGHRHRLSPSTHKRLPNYSSIHNIHPSLEASTRRCWTSVPSHSTGPLDQARLLHGCYFTARQLLNPLHHPHLSFQKTTRWMTYTVHPSGSRHCTHHRHRPNHRVNLRSGHLRLYGYLRCQSRLCYRCWQPGTRTCLQRWSGKSNVKRRARVGARARCKPRIVQARSAAGLSWLRIGRGERRHGRSRHLGGQSHACRLKPLPNCIDGWAL